MELKFRFSNNLILLDIASLLMLERAKVLPYFYLTEFLVSDQHAEKQNFSWDKSSPFGIHPLKRYIYNLVTKERFHDKPNLSTLSKPLEAMKFHAIMNGVSAIAIPKLGCGLDQINWQEVVKLLRDIFAYANVQLVV